MVHYPGTRHCEIEIVILKESKQQNMNKAKVFILKLLVKQVLPAGLCYSLKS